MAIKKLKKIVPITLGALTATALAVSLPLALTSCNANNESTNQNTQVVAPDSDSIENVETSNPSNGSTNVDSSEVIEDNEEIKEENKPNQDQNVDSSFGQNFGDEIETKLLGSLINNKNNSKLIYGDSVSFKILPKLKGKFNKYTYNWKIVDLSNESVIYSSNNSENSELNFSNFNHVGTYSIQGQINQVNKEGIILTSETYEQKVSVYPKINVSLEENINFKNNQSNATINPKISFDGINEKDFSKAESLYSFSWTKDGEVLSNNLFTRTNDQSLKIKLATENLKGIYKFTATLNEEGLSNSVSATTNVSVDEASFKIDLLGQNNVKIGDDVNLNANIRTTRSVSSYTYRWYVKDNKTSEAQEIYDSNSSTYTLKAASKNSDSGNKYYVVAKDNSTGEVQWTNVPYSLEVQNDLKDGFKLSNESQLSIKVGETTEIDVDKIAIPLNRENVNVEYEWHVKVGENMLPNLGNDHQNSLTSYYYDGFTFNLSNNGKKLSIKNNQDGDLKEVNVQLIVRFWSGKKLLDGVSSGWNTLQSTKNDSVFKIDSSKNESTKSSLKSFNNFKNLIDKNEIEVGYDDFTFGVFKDSKTKFLNSLGLDSNLHNNVDVSFRRVNDTDDNMTFDVFVTIKNKNYSWTDSSAKSLFSVKSDYAISDNVLTIKNVETSQKTLFKVVQNNEVSKENSSNKKLSIKLENTSSSFEFKNSNNGIFLTTWYYKDKDGHIEKVTGYSSKFKGVEFSDSQEKFVNHKVVNSSIDLSKVSGDFSEGSFFAYVLYSDQSSTSQTWKYIYNLAGSYSQEGMKISSNINS